MREKESKRKNRGIKGTIKIKTVQTTYYRENEAKSNCKDWVTRLNGKSSSFLEITSKQLIIRIFLKSRI